MSNDPRDHDGQKLKQALQILGANLKIRTALIEFLREQEKNIDYKASVRDDVTGPIIDALHTEHDRYEKTLADGTRFEFLYRTKIARDFLLSAQTHPTHVWEPQTTRLLQKIMTQTDGDVLIGGAYFGDHAVLLAKQIQAENRQVHCFEPNADQAKMLERNMEINALKNWQLHRLGLWHNSSERLRLDGFDSFANVVALQNQDDGEGFSTIRIDDYVQSVSRKISVIMLDIEGAEFKALQGARQVLEQQRPWVIFEVHRDYVDWTEGLMQTSLCQLFARLNYAVYALRDFNTNQEMDGKKIELIPADQVHLEGPPHGFNMIAVPHADALLDDVFKIVAHVSPKLLRHKDPSLHHPLDGMPN